MAIELATRYAPYVDELFSKESKLSLLAGGEYDVIGDAFGGANAVKIYKISTAEMHDYGRRGAAEGNWSRYGEVKDLDATTETLLIKKDRSFTFVIDKLDRMETENQLEGASALARQIREVVIPEIDIYAYGVLVEGAGNKPEAVALTKDNIYEQILFATKALDDALVPEEGRVLMVNPEVYRLMKLNPEIVMATDVSAEDRKKGVIGTLDGAQVIKVPASRLPEKFGFMLSHPSAAVAPVKLEDYKLHENPPGINGTLVEGRIAYDCFVFENKANAIYYQETATA